MSFSHFPSRFHASIFRMWETVPAKRIAEALNLSQEVIEKVATDMGLPKQENMGEWDTKGYITTIRNLWYLLPYEQLLKVLGWTEERLAHVLKEEDFLYEKLGSFKPLCENITPPDTLSEEQERMLVGIKTTMKSYFTDVFHGEKPFCFFEQDEAVREGERTEVDDTIKMLFSYCGLYVDVLECDTAVSLPDALLAKYQSVGINAVWIHCCLYQLVEFPFNPERSKGWQDRQRRLKELVCRAESYGIKIFIYLNEPRSIPLDFFEQYPKMRGKTREHDAAICMSDPQVLNYLRESVYKLCSAVPEIGGFITITFGENLTHCKSKRLNIGIICQACKDYAPHHMALDIITAIYEESIRVNPRIKNIAWAHAWEVFLSDEQRYELIKVIPRDVIVMCTSEIPKPFCIGGVKGIAKEYSLAHPGPSELSAAS